MASHGRQPSRSGQKLVDADPAVGPMLKVPVRSWTTLLGAGRSPGLGEPGREHVERTLHRLFVAGVTARDPEAYFDRTYHPDVTIHEAPTLPYGGDYHALEGRLRPGVSPHAATNAGQMDRFGVHSRPCADRRSTFRRIGRTAGQWRRHDAGCSNRVSTRSEAHRVGSAPARHACPTPRIRGG
jgi:hypothetical protein